MDVVLLHDRIAPDARPDERDVLAQVDAVAEALRALDHRPRIVPFSLDWPRVRAELERPRPDCVFNLVESVEGNGRLIHWPPALMEVLGIPVTGASAAAMFLTTHKPLAKRWLRRHDLPTPDWHGDDGPFRPGRYIIKSTWEHASLGLDADALVDARSPDELLRLTAARAARLGGEAFAETYVEGREFNISLLAVPGGPRVLPHAEILFRDFPASRPRIVDYAAKWDEQSFAYRHTERTFEFAVGDAALLETLSDLSRRCWRLFGLSGYARVDFRVDAAGRPFILEINANPCLSPNAGFAAALERAGIPFREAVARIIDDARARFASPASFHRSP